MVPFVPPPPMALPSTTPRAFSCACGRPVFFNNSQCLACQRPLGYDPGRGTLLALERLRSGGWREAGVPVRRARRYARCANLSTRPPATGCWMRPSRRRGSSSAAAAA